MKFPEINKISKADTHKNLVGVIYGEVGVGKSFLVNTFPAPLFINTDGNIEPITNGGIMKINDAEGENDLEKFKNLAIELVKQKDSLKEQGYETIVFDVVDSTYDYIVNDVLEKNNKESLIAFEDHGQTYNLVRTKWFKIITKIIREMRDNFNLIFISYEGIKSLQIAEQSVNEVYIPSIISSIVNKNKRRENNISTIVNFVGRLKKTERIGTNAEGNKVRKVVRTLQLTETKKEYAMNRFNFEGEIIEPTYEKIKKELIGE